MDLPKYCSSYASVLLGRSIVMRDHERACPRPGTHHPSCRLTCRSHRRSIYNSAITPVMRDQGRAYPGPTPPTTVFDDHRQPTSGSSPGLRRRNVDVSWYGDHRSRPLSQARRAHEPGDVNITRLGGFVSARRIRLFVEIRYAQVR